MTRKSPKPIDHNARAATYARLMQQEHFDAHGGAFAIGNVVGVFLNMGEPLTSPIYADIRETLADDFGFTVIGEGQSGDADANYSWAAILDGANPDYLDDLTTMVWEAVRTERPDYPRYQFQTIR